MTHGPASPNIPHPENLMPIPKCDPVHSEIASVEGFIVGIQVSLNEIMIAKGVTRGELARRMKVDKSVVKALFSDDCNVSVRRLAKALHHLGERATLDGPILATLREGRARRAVADDAARKALTA